MTYKKRGNLIYTESERKQLVKISRSKTEEFRKVQRAKIFLLYMNNTPVAQIAKEVGLSRKSIYVNVDRALAFGPIAGLSDLSGRGVHAVISDEDKAWVIHIACSSPKDYGYAYEVWTYSQLVKITYYLERRDKQFEEKMAQVLAVYKEVQLLNVSEDKDEKSTNSRKCATVSYDEKPGIQAIKNIAAQLSPVPGKYKTIGRDYEYKRLGTVSLLAGIDLHDGTIIPMVEDRHRSSEFIKYLKKLIDHYPPDWKIRIILDNHSAHRSKETMRFLETVAGKFEFVFTPTHGSWLNMIEMFFSKIARSFLRHIRVDSIEELKQRIYQGIEEINQDPVVFKWRYKMEEGKIETAES